MIGVACPVGAGRALDDVLKSSKALRGLFKHKFPKGKPYSLDDSTKIWNKLKEMGLEPRWHKGHPDSKHWKGPHINVKMNVGGRPIHIPVHPDFKR